MMHNLRKYLIAGLLVWLPLAATVVVIRLLINLLNRTILLIPPEFRPETVLGFSIPGFGIIVGIFILLVTGMFAANLFGRRMVNLWESILGRIPLVRTIYTSVKQVLETFFGSDSRPFRKVVLVEYPKEDVWCLGFLSNKGLEKACEKSGRNLVSVFVPTTPNPTSGFIVMYPEESVTELDMTVEEAFKYIISLGVVIKPEAKDKLAQTTAGS